MNHPFLVPAMSVDDDSDVLASYRGKEGLLKFARIAEGIDMETGQPFKFGGKGWEWQLDLLAELYEHKRVIILKARQMGVTWLASLYALWMALVHPYTRTLIVSRNREQASATLRSYICELYRRLPDEIKREVKPISQQAFFFRLSNGSEIMTQPSTEDAGRGFTGALVIMDEVAFQPYAELTYASIKPAIDKGGQLLMFSTAKGTGNFFHKMWTDAREGKNGFHCIFLPYYLHPQRDVNWREEKRREFPSEWMVAQEYPESEEEAFVLSGRPVFGTKVIEELLKEVREPLQTPVELAVLDPHIQVFSLPEDGGIYVIGVDCAEGRVHGDYSAASVIEARTGEQVAEYVSHELPHVVALHVDLLAKYYQAARVIVEKNGVGNAVISKLIELGTKNLYKEKRRTRGYGVVSVYGWQTTSKTKPLLISTLIEGVALGKLKVRSKELVEEMKHYRYDDDGNTSAPWGMTDDRIMAIALAWWQVTEWKRKFSDLAILPAYRSPSRERSFLERMIEEWEEFEGDSVIKPTAYLLGGSDYDLLLPL